MQRVRELSMRSQTPDRRLSNEWRHSAGLIDHTYRGITTPNCDTLYSGAWLDLAEGPILIEVPASGLPYWSIAVMDLNTDNIAILGSRYPGSGTMLVCEQDYSGKLPDAIPHVRSTSTVVWLLARYLIGNDELMAQAETMRRGVRLGRLQGDASVLPHPACPPCVPLVAAVRKDPENFWQVIRSTLDEDASLAGRLTSPLNREIQNVWPSSVSCWTGLDTDLQQRFAQAFNQVLQSVTANNSGNMQTRNHWRYPGKDIGNFGDNHQYRAEVSLWGLGALPTAEVIYVSAITDEQGALLQGSNTYRFRIPAEGIPAEAFWSLTLYEVDSFGGMYFAANALKRYAVGDRTEGLKINSDGCIDIWITHKQPATADRQTNWLPAPVGLFRLMIRAYAPSELFQAGATLPPAIERCSDKESA